MGEALIIRKGGGLPGGLKVKKAIKTELITGVTDWEVPEGIINNQISVLLFGGGGGGNNNGGGAGGGGNMNKGIFTVTPGQKIHVTIGIGGAPASQGAAGGTSTFGDLLSATGGDGGSSSGGSGGTGGSAPTWGSGRGYYGGGAGGTFPGDGGEYGGGGGGGAATRPWSGFLLSNGGNGGKYGGGGGCGQSDGNSSRWSTDPTYGGHGGYYGGGGGSLNGVNGGVGGCINVLNINEGQSGLAGNGGKGGYTCWVRGGDFSTRYNAEPGGAGTDTSTWTNVTKDDNGYFRGNGLGGSITPGAYYNGVQHNGGGGGGGGGFGGNGGRGSGVTWSNSYLYDKEDGWYWSNIFRAEIVAGGGGGGYGIYGNGGGDGQENGGIAAGGSPVGYGGAGICVIQYYYWQVS